MSIFDTLKAMNEQYKATPAAPDSARIPDGKYRAVCKEARLIEPSGAKPMRLSCSFIIMEGDYAGRMLFISQRIVAEQAAFAHLKSFIAQMQVPVTDLYQLEAALPEFTGRIITASVVTSKADARYQNVYVDEYIGKGDITPCLKRDAQPKPFGPAAINGFQPVDIDNDDLPFN